MMAADTTSDALPNLYDMTRDELDRLVRQLGEPRYRVDQLWNWLYRQKADSFEEMTTLSKALRERIAAETRLGSLEVAREVDSSDGETRKFLLRLPDGQLIETVLMRYDRRITACISTQAGCAMGCVFCATGQMGFARDLTPGEIIEQVVLVARILEARGERLSNVVLMGMGEPLHNYEASLAAIKRMTDQTALNIGQRHVTISTVGLVPAIRRFAEEGTQVRLAVSLHAATDERRNDLIPINKRWPLRELIGACHYYVEQTGRRVMIEWAMIAGENDSQKEAHALGQLLKGLLCIVNIIPLNPTTAYEGQPANRERIEAFRGVLGEYGVPSTVRVRRGIDIDAGCGQLKATVTAEQTIDMG